MKLTDILKLIKADENLQLYDNSGYLDEWAEWYSGTVKSWHNYKVYNGKRHIQMHRLSLNMAKKVCEDWANLLVNEKTDITLSNPEAQKNLELILKKNRFWRKANQDIEKIMALGGVAWCVSVENLPINADGSIIDGGTVKISSVNAKNIVPITIEDDVITECAFWRIDTGRTYITAHVKNEAGNYEIHNIIAQGVDLNNLTFDPDTDQYYIFDTHNNIPWFVCLKPNVVNNVDINSPLGISIFANAIDCLKEIDLIFDSYANEFILGKKRIFVNAEQMAFNSLGEQVEVFDSNDVVMYQLPTSPDGSLTIQDVTQSLRVTEHQTALQSQLNNLAASCGLGTEHYKFDKSGVSTATQIVSENSQLFRNIKKHEIIIEEALTELVEAIIYAANTFTQTKINATADDIAISFDDSIIEDKATEMANDRLDVSLGVLSKAEYRAKWYNEDLQTAQRMIEEIDGFTIDDSEGYAYDDTDTGAQMDGQGTEDA